MDATFGCELMSFLDAYSNHHKIFLAKEDKAKTAFIIPIDTYCFTRMPFGHKNVGATFTQLITKVLVKQLGCNIEVYVDDIVVKSTLTTNLQETFTNL